MPVSRNTMWEQHVAKVAGDSAHGLQAGVSVNVEPHVKDTPCHRHSRRFPLTVNLFVARSKLMAFEGLFRLASLCILRPALAALGGTHGWYLLKLKPRFKVSLSGYCRLLNSSAKVATHEMDTTNPRTQPHLATAFAFFEHLSTPRK